MVFLAVYGWALPWALLATFALVVAFRGFVDVIAHRLIPRASLYGAGRELVEDDIVAAAARLVLATRSSAGCSGSGSSWA